MTEACMVTAGEVGYFKGGSGFPLRFQGQQSGHLPFFKVSDMNNPGNELFMRAANNYISESTRKRMGAVRMPAGAIVFAKVGAAIFLERRRILAQDSCIDNNLAAFVVDPARLSVRYAHYLLSDIKMGALVSTTALPSLNGSQLRSVSLRVPDLAQQRRVVEALSSADESIVVLQDLSAKKRAIKHGMMHELLTGRIRLPGFEGEWQEQRLSSVSSLKGRIGWQGLSQSEFTSEASKPYLITGMNFKDGAIRWSEVYHVSEERFATAPEIQLRPGDVLMTKDGTIGKLLFVDSIPSPGRATLNSHLLLFRPKGQAYDPLYLYYHLGSPRFAQHIELHKSGTTFYGISQTAVGKYDLPLPLIEEQVAIGRALADVDAELSALEAMLESSRAIKRGMMQELLTGRTRIPVPEAVAT